MTASYRPPAPPDCHQRTDAWCQGRPAYQCELENLGTVPGVHHLHSKARGEILQTYGWVCPDIEVIDEIIALGSVIEHGAGGGYWARLIRDRGGNVVAYDWTPPERVWTDLIEGDESLLEEYTDRTLLMVMPQPRPGAIEKVLPQWLGNRLVIATSTTVPIYDEEEEALDTLGWVLDSERPLPEILGHRFVSFWKR